MGQPFAGGFPPPPEPMPPRKETPRWVIAVIITGTLVALACFGGATAFVLKGVNSEDPPGGRSTLGQSEPRAPAKASPVPFEPAGPPPADKTYAGRGVKIVPLRLDEDYQHIAKITHSGSRNFMVESRNATGNKVDLVVNDIGDYDGLRPLDLGREQPASLRIRADGAWKVTVMVVDKAPRWTGKASGKAGAALLRVDPAAAGQKVRFTHKGQSNCAVIVRSEKSSDLLVNDIGRYSGDMVLPTGTRFVEIETSGSWTLSVV